MKEMRTDTFIVMTPFMEIFNARMKLLKEKGFSDSRKLVSTERIIEKGMQPLLLLINIHERTYFLFPSSSSNQGNLDGLIGVAKIPVYSKNAFENFMKTVI